MLGKNLRSLWVETDPIKAIARARRSVERGRYDIAISALKDAIEAVGEEPRIRLELSQIQVKAGQVREAADGLKAFLKAHPEEHDQVRDFASWARSHNDDVSPLFEILGEHYVSRKDLGAALDALERVEKKSLQTLLEGRLASLNRFIEKTPQSVPKSALPLLYFAAIVYEAEADYPKAAETYRRIATVSPSEMPTVMERFKGILSRNYRSAPLRAAFADILLGAGEEARAIEEYQMMVEADPRAASTAATAVEQIAATSADPSTALLALVRIRQKEGKVEDLLRTAGVLIATGKHLDDLVTILEAVLAEGKQDPRIHLVIGEAAQRAGKISRASTAMSAAASHPSAEIRARARESLEALVQDHPEDRRAVEALAEHLMKEGRFDECVVALDRLVRVDPAATPLVASRLQTVLLTRPGHHGAESLLERLAPSLPDTRLASAFLRRQLRSGEENARAALEALEPILAAHPHDPDVILAAAEAHTACGNMEPAWEIVRLLVNGMMGPDPSLLHLLVLIGGSSPALCRRVSETFRKMAPALAGSAEGAFALGEMAARAGDVAGAVETLRPAATFSQEAAAEVIATLRSGVGVGLPGETAVALAEALLDAGDSAGAASVLSSAADLPPSASRPLSRIEEALRAQPANADLRVALAAALSSGGRAVRARQIADEGIRLGGESAPPVLHLASGDAWLKDGNLTEAINSYSRAMARNKSLAGEAARRIEKVLETDIGHAGSHLALGRARLLEGRPRDGVNELLTAWSIKPALGSVVLKDLTYAARAFPLEPQVDLARAQILLGQGEVESAAEALGSALQTSPSIALEVLARLEPMTRSHPSCARARFHAARAWHLRGRCAEASEAYLAAAETDPALAERSSAGLCELMRAFPNRPDPHLARARLYVAQANPGPAAESYLAAAARGAAASETIEPLRDLARQEGPQRGRVLIALGCAARALDLPGEAARAFEQAASAAPDQVAAVREEIDGLCEEHPGSPEAVAARARVAMKAMDADAAIENVESLIDRHPDRYAEAEVLASEIARVGGDGARCAWVRARALVAGGSFDPAASLLEEWIPRASDDLRVRMILLKSRVQRRRGETVEAHRSLVAAERLATDHEAFLAALHAETLAALVAAADRAGTRSDMWRALHAAIDLGDADRAGQIAGDLGLTREGRDSGAVEALARIECLRGRYGMAGELLSSAPPSALKAHVLRRAGRLVQAAACLAEIAPTLSEPAPAAADVYRRLAAAEFLKEPGCLEAETRIDFSQGKESTKP